jgi:predicted MFS family arabinose efflux permease
VLITANSAPGLEAPILIATAVSLLATIFTGIFQPAGERRSASTSLRDESLPQRGLFNGLLLLTGANAGAIGSFHVGLSLRGRNLTMSPSALSMMFAECSLIMLVVQALVFSRWVRPEWTRLLIVPTLLFLAGSFFLLAGVIGNLPLRVAVDLFAGSAGVLTPILLFWISRATGDAQGALLGWQTSIASLGQTLGSVATGLFLASSLWNGSFFMIMAVILLLAGLAAVPMGRGLSVLRASASAARTIGFHPATKLDAN